MLPVIFSFFMAYLNLPDVCTTTVETCKSRQMTSLKNSMTSSWLISRTTGVNGSVSCGLLCLRDKRCVSFLYNDVIHDCRLFAIVKTSSDMTPSTEGYRYYDTCKAAGYYGSNCSSNDQCRLNKTQCFQSRCRCQEGYSFDPSTAACVARCSSYGPEFEAFPEWFINDNNEETITNFVSTEACLDTCRNATTYVCRTVDVRLSPSPACNTASVTKLDVPLSDWLDLSTWTTVHYQRHCSL